MYNYSTTLELKKKELIVSRDNIKQASAIQVTFISEKKLQKQSFFSKYDHMYTSYRCVHFEHLLGWECANSCHNLRTKKEGIYVKCLEYKTSNWHTGDLHLGN